MSDYLRPHGMHPTQFFCPWYSPGKNTRVDWHFLLQRIFPTQGLSSRLLLLLHWQADYLPLAPPAKPLNPQASEPTNLSTKQAPAQDTLDYRTRRTSRHASFAYIFEAIRVPVHDPGSWWGSGLTSPHGKTWRTFQEGLLLGRECRSGLPELPMQRRGSLWVPVWYVNLFSQQTWELGLQ